MDTNFTIRVGGVQPSNIKLMMFICGISYQFFGSGYVSSKVTNK